MMRGKERGEIMLYALSIEQARRLPDAFCRAWFPKRLAHVYAREDDALRSLAAGALVAGVLGVQEEEIACSAHGKPLIAGRHFSLSHSGEYALLAVGDTPIGTDIEKIEPRRVRTSERLFQPEELLWLREQPEEGFFSLWTLKESVLKMRGCGLSVPLPRFSVLPLLEGGSIVYDGAVCFGAVTVFDGHCVAVCALQPVAPLLPQRMCAEEITNHG